MSWCDGFLKRKLPNIFPTKQMIKVCILLSEKLLYLKFLGMRMAP